MQWQCTRCCLFENQFEWLLRRTWNQPLWKSRSHSHTASYLASTLNKHLRSKKANRCLYGLINSTAPRSGLLFTVLPAQVTSVAKQIACCYVHSPRVCVPAEPAECCLGGTEVCCAPWRKLPSLRRVEKRWKQTAGTATTKARELRNVLECPATFSRKINQYRNQHSG